MRARHFRSTAHFFKFSPLLLRLKLLPTWVMLSLATNAVLLMTLMVSLMRHSASTQAVSAQPGSGNGALVSSTTGLAANGLTAGLSKPIELGERRQLTYEQWLDQLKQEASAVAQQQPSHLSILAGDSISLWFPQDLLPAKRNWLNQGISGETSSGLLKRLDLFGETKPETIFVMIGINDLLRGATDKIVLDNQRQIIEDLSKAHPHAQIVMQSILPHAAESNWEGKQRLLAISNQRIQDLNRQLETLARQEGAYFLDLYPLFANPNGDLRPELTTDGLHLSPLGYQTWSIALQVYSREVLEVSSN